MNPVSKYLNRYLTHALILDSYNEVHRSIVTWEWGENVVANALQTDAKYSKKLAHKTDMNTKALMPAQHQWENTIWHR